LVHFHHEKFYVFSEHREAAGWVKNIRGNPNVSVQFEKCSMKAVVRMLDYRKERQLWDEVQAIADRKYGWDDGLPVEITAAEKPHAEQNAGTVA